MKILYETKAVSTGGRDGKVQVENSPLTFQMALPTELGGSGKEGANPEQLFAAGYSACFGSALQLVAGKMKLAIKSATVSANISIGSDETGGFALAANLVITLLGIDQATADALVKEAHEVCPYSKATRGNIVVTLSTIVE